MDDRAGGYSGSDSYRHVEPLLFDRGKELLIISPYIGMRYARKLVGIGRRKRIKIVTSRYSQDVVAYIRRHSRYLLYGYAKAVSLLAIGAFVSAYFSFYAIAIFAAAGAALISGMGYVMYRLSRNSQIEARISYRRFVHEKAYISDCAAVVGSANLTYSGLHKNVERVEIITDQDRIEGLRTHFFEIWERSN
ncbi:MAG: hypothetical protein KGH94_04790 [Candidatus Micrarchaeota archaeon]|nr:hypothetical protein [Candidatus Micrarchaeota archaeon]